MMTLKQRLISNNMTEGTLVLNRSLDFETLPWFSFQIVAMVSGICYVKINMVT